MSYFPAAFAQDGAVSNFVTATSNLIAAIRTMSPTIFLLGLVFLLACVGAWIWFPKTRNFTSWVWGSIALIIIIYFIGTFYADPIKATFSAVLDPIKWISPSGT
jgi:glucan phosphoethanolaminetransferase (alkaline phosphatase superfamily)